MQAKKTESGLREATVTSNRINTLKNTNTVRKFTFLMDESYKLGAIDPRGLLGIDGVSPHIQKAGVISR